MSVPIPPGLKVPPLTRLTKKRLFIPTVDVSENPFCQDRQLTDAVAKIQCKPQMVVDVEVALAKRELKSDLPTSVFAPPRDVMARKQNALFGTIEGATYLANTQAEKAAMERRARGDDGADDDGPGVFVPDPNDLFAPPDKTYFPDPFEVAADLTTKMPALKDVSHPTTFGHRPRSASRHFDPLTMSANRFGRSAKNLPCAGLLSASDLHRMLKHGQDVVGMGPSPAERGEAPLGSSVLQSSQSSHPVGGSTEEVEGSDTLRRQNQSLLEQSSAPGGAVAHTRHIGSGGGAVPGGNTTLDGSSTIMTVTSGTTGTSAMDTTGDSLASSDGNGISVRAEITRRTTGMTIMERTAPPGLVKAPEWMGGVFSVGMGKSLFHKTETEKLASKKEKRLRKLRKKHRAGRPNWHGKVYFPPPQRAFKSALAEDDASLMTSKDKLRKYARLSGGVLPMPTCKARQVEDERQRSDTQARLIRQSKKLDLTREYARNSGSIHSRTPRVKFKHDVEEIMREVERRMENEALRAEEEEEEEGGGEELEDRVDEGSRGENSATQYTDT